MDGINAARVTISQAHFDAGRCAKAIEALRHYQAEWDEEACVYRKAPRHDWTSHAADSFRYLALAWRTPIVRNVEPRREPKEFVLVAQPDGTLKANYTMWDVVNRNMRRKGIRPSGYRAS